MSYYWKTCKRCYSRFIGYLDAPGICEDCRDGRPARMRCPACNADGRTFQQHPVCAECQNRPQLIHVTPLSGVINPPFSGRHAA